MPESPPVMRAVLPSSLPLPAYPRIASWGSGVMSPVVPGTSCCWVGNSWSLIRDALPTHSKAIAPVVVTLPAKRKAVWRSEDSMSKGSSAETPSRGTTTPYHRSAALAAV